MTDYSDLLAAITARPQDDAPRLIAADWLDDRGEADWAEFIRDQIQLQQVPSWDPLAIRARHQRRETLGIGRPFYGTLPELPLFLKWHPEQAFRRGFGSGVMVHQLSGLLAAGQQLFDAAPVDELWLTAATLDEWREFARSPWLANVRKLHFQFGPGLIMPIRCLAESPYAFNIDEIWFDTLVTPAAGTIIEALSESKLAGQLQGLHLRLVEHDAIEDIQVALRNSTYSKIKSFSFDQSDFNENSISGMGDISLLESTHHFSMRSSMSQLNVIPFTQKRFSFQTIDYSQNVRNFLFDEINDMTINEAIRNLKLNDSYIRIRDLRRFLYRGCWPLLKCLNVANMVKEFQDIDMFIHGPVWSQLAELNLTGISWGTIDEAAIRKLPVTDHLVALVVSPDCVSSTQREVLTQHFGDRLVWAAPREHYGLAR